VSVYTPAFKPFAHQQEALDKSDGAEAFAYLMQMRTGKTKTTIDDYGRLELAGKVRNFGLIAPGGVYKTWKGALEEHLSADLKSRLLIAVWQSGMGAKDMRRFQALMDAAKDPAGPPVALLMNVEALSSVKAAQTAMLDFLAADKNYLAVDECFSPDTEILTPDGPVPIFLLEPGQKVVGSFGPVKIKRILVNTSVKSCFLKLSNGTIIKTTPDHPFFTSEGWVSASNLKGKYVCDREMSDLRNRIFGASKAKQKILQHILFSEMADATARNSGENLHGSTLQKDVFGTKRETTGSSFLEQRDSYATGVCCEIERNSQSHEPQVQRYRREWEAAYETASKFACGSWPGMDPGICNRVGEEASRLSHLLQSGPWKSKLETGSGVRRIQPQQLQGESTCPEERTEDCGVWVEDCEIVEFESPRAFFNLELDGTPHFFAGGVLVHNCTIIKNPSSQRTKFINGKLKPLANYRRILSGLPTPKDPLDLYGQFEFLDWRILGHRSYYSFRARYAIMHNLIVGGRSVPVVKGYRDLDDLSRRILDHSSRVLLSDCYDLPPKSYSFREVEMTPEQKRLYAEMKQFATTQLASGEHVTASIVIAQIIRLHQILCGHTMDEDGTFHEIAENRTSALLDLLEEFDGKAIIWCSYGHDIAKVAAALEKRYGEGSVARFWGGNTKTREAEEKNFLQLPSCRFMVATAAAGGRGRTWTNSSLVVYYSNSADLEHRLQSEERPQAVGKVDPVAYVDLIVRDTVEEKMISALRAKMNMATAITADGYKDWIV